MARPEIPNNVPMSELFGRHLGERIAIVGNGPSAGKVSYDEVSEHNDVVIGVNRMWAWEPPDYYLFVGKDIADSLASVLRKPDHPLLGAHWIMPAHRPLPPHLPRKITQFWPMNGHKRRVTEEMVSRKWVDRPKPELVIHRTIVLAACQLALIMGARSIELFGCEGVTKIGEEPRFTPTKPAVAGQVKKYGQIQETLDRFHADWSGKVQLWNSSQGYEGIWEAGQ